MEVNVDLSLKNYQGCRCLYHTCICYIKGHSLASTNGGLSGSGDRSIISVCSRSFLKRLRAIRSMYLYGDCFRFALLLSFTWGDYIQGNFPLFFHRIGYILVNHKMPLKCCKKVGSPNGEFCSKYQY